MKTLARNTILPLLLVGPLLAWCVFMARDTTTDYPRALLPSAMVAGGLCLLALALMISSLYRWPSREAMIGALVGSGLSFIPAVGGGTFGIMMLAFSGDSGMEAAAQVLPVTLGITALLILLPLTLGVCLGALIGQRKADQRALLPTGPEVPTR